MAGSSGLLEQKREKYGWLLGFPFAENTGYSWKKYKDDKTRALAYRVNAAEIEEAILGLSK